jgi:hypothetical protein
MFRPNELDIICNSCKKLDYLDIEKDFKQFVDNKYYPVEVFGKLIKMSEALFNESEDYYNQCLEDWLTSAGQKIYAKVVNNNVGGYWIIKVSDIEDCINIKATCLKESNYEVKK